MTITTIDDFNRFKGVFLAALCVWREARGEPIEGKRGVYNVLKNRCADPRWPNTLSEVVLQPKQFSSFNQDDRNVVIWPKDWDLSWQECVSVVMEDAPDNTNGATHYVATWLVEKWKAENTTPKWVKNLTFVATLGKQTFFK